MTDPITRALRKTGDLPPGVNRFYPPARGLRAQLREAARLANVRPNRADRRRWGRVGPKAHV